MPVTTTANSSPPSRATRSDSRTQSSKRLAQSTEHLIAGPVAQTVVDFLEAIEIDAKHRGLLAAAVHALQDLGSDARGNAARLGSLRKRIVPRQKLDLPECCCFGTDVRGGAAIARKAPTAFVDRLSCYPQRTGVLAAAQASTHTILRNGWFAARLAAYCARNFASHGSRRRSNGCPSTSPGFSPVAPTNGSET